MLANFANYRKIFGTQCNGTQITLDDNKMVSHVYGWAPFTEAATGTGCPADANLLENTPGYSTGTAPKIDYTEYLRVKLEFDKLNYGANIKAPLKDPQYVFNPWVVLIHGSQYVNAPNVYAYSVDDAVGNIQAYGTGFIIDVGSTVHLENQDPAAPPINIAYAIGDQTIKFTNYRLCKNDLDHDIPVNPAFQSFVISANNPETCPIFFLDNKVPPQLYSFTITKPPPFTFFPNPDVPPFPMWTQETAAVIDCTADAGPAPYQPSSKNWCCEKLNPPNGNGVFAYSKPEPHNAHQSEIHTAVTHIAEQLTTNPNPNTCNMGQ
jgi:hypothetical protein